MAVNVLVLQFNRICSSMDTTQRFNIQMLWNSLYWKEQPRLSHLPVINITWCVMAEASQHHRPHRGLLIVMSLWQLGRYQRWINSVSSHREPRYLRTVGQVWEVSRCTPTALSRQQISRRQMENCPLYQTIAYRWRSWRQIWNRWNTRKRKR